MNENVFLQYEVDICSTVVHPVPSYAM